MQMDLSKFGSHFHGRGRALDRASEVLFDAAVCPDLVGASIEAISLVASSDRLTVALYVAKAGR
jgi:hypothetical protein